MRIPKPSRSIGKAIGVGRKMAKTTAATRAHALPTTCVATVWRWNFSCEVSGSCPSLWSGACTAAGLGRWWMRLPWMKEIMNRYIYIYICTRFLFFFFYVLAHGKRASQILSGPCFKIIQMIILFILNSHFALKRYHGHHIPPSLEKFRSWNLKCKISTNQQTGLLSSLKSLFMHFSTSCP